MTGILEAAGVRTVGVSSPLEAESLKEAVPEGLRLYQREGELEAGLPLSVLAPTSLSLLM